jgi:hypothetical protein
MMDQTASYPQRRLSGAPGSGTVSDHWDVISLRYLVTVKSGEALEHGEEAYQLD